TVNNPVSWMFLSLSIIIGAFSHYIRSLRSILLIEPLNYKVRKSMSFYSVMVCYLANLALPRLGEVLRCTFLQRYENVPFQKTLGTVVTERAFDVVCWLLMLVVAIWLNTSVLSHLVVDKESGLSLGAWMEQKGMSIISNYFLYILGACVILFALLIYFTRNWWGKIPFFVKVKNIVLGVWQGLVSIKDLKRPWLFLLYTFLLWFFYFLGVYICFFAFDYLRDLGPVPAYSVLVFGAIGYMVAQGGLGAYPLIVAGILVLYGIDYNAALAAGWIGWSAQSVMIIIFGLAALILAPFSKRNTQNASMPKE
ncbi:MAG: lysylphosphatidylglycerol synthase transmembrane domain-containing protein, partial [Bacteroidales bacterium]